MARLGRPTLAVVGGSGFGAWFEGLGGEVEPWSGGGFSAVPGHAARLRAIGWEGRTVWCFEGRRHLYEGASVPDVVAPVEWAFRAGARGVLLTCAVGGLAEDHGTGDLALVSDHLNLTGVDPLVSVSVERRDPAFLDLQNAYDPDIRGRWRALARERGTVLREGVLAAVHGPSYETPAEVRALRALGADFAGMSTVPETIWARYRGLRVTGLAIVSNPGAGRNGEAIDHADVLVAVARAIERNRELLNAGLAATVDAFAGCD